jgi:hypothetical protein
MRSLLIHSKTPILVSNLLQPDILKQEILVKVLRFEMPDHY